MKNYKQNKKQRQKKYNDCMSKAKTKKQKLNCARLHKNIFDSNG
tara:strand:- start:803 stop:934 length:132 start_codon:yes stop_codon:yes gene_type:complete